MQYSTSDNPSLAVFLSFTVMPVVVGLVLSEGGGVGGGGMTGRVGFGVG